MIITSLLTLVLEGLFSYLIPLKIVLIYYLFLSFDYKKDKDKYFIIGVILGVIYDLLYGPYLFFYTFLFSVIGLLFYLLKKKFVYKSLFIFFFIEYILYCILNSQIILIPVVNLSWYIVINILVFFIIKKIFSYKLN